MGHHPEPEMGTEQDVILERIFAFIIDTILVGVVALILSFSGLIFGSFFSTMRRGVGAPNLTIMIFVGIIIAGFTLFYAFLLEGYWGQTIGKKVVGVVVVKEDGSKCTYEASIIRNLLRIIDSFPQFYIVGLIVIAITDRRQRVGDRLANTVVVKTAR